MKARALKLAMAIALAAAAASCGGCTQFFAWFVATFWPPERIKPVYEPPKDKKVLVLVEERGAAVTYHIKKELTQRVSVKLREHKLARETIGYDQVQDLAASRDFSQLNPAQVGAKLGADLVLCVKIEDFALKDNIYSPLWQARLATSVWFVEVAKGVRLWPAELPQNTGYSLPLVEFKQAENAPPPDGDTVIRTMAEQMADRIVKLFYEHSEEGNPYHDPGPREPAD